MAVKGEFSYVETLPLLCSEKLQDGGDTAGVGYYKTNLQNGITVELSASRHAGIMQYTFPADERHVLVDLSHVSFTRIGFVFHAQAKRRSIFRTKAAVMIRNSTPEARLPSSLAKPSTLALPALREDGT